MPRAEPSSAIRLRAIEEMRLSLPVGQYVFMLNQAVFTGKMPKLDQDGRPTGEFDDLTGKDRIALAQWLTDKVMPASPPKLDISVQGVRAAQIVETPDLAQTLSNEQISGLIAFVDPDSGELPT